jgi:hypothetical protein
VRIGCGDERLPEALRHFHRAPVGIDEPRPKVAELDRIKTIDLLHELFPDRTT